MFMFGTAQEWRRLIYEHGLTISTNLFGTTYYSLVGLHAFHVTVGLVMLTIVARGWALPAAFASHTRRASACCRSTGTSSTSCGSSCSPWCTSSAAEEEPWQEKQSTTIEVPAPTAWPLVLAAGVTLMFAGLLTNMSVTALGVVLSVAGCIGWLREVVPGEHEEEMPVVADDGESQPNGAGSIGLRSHPNRCAPGFPSTPIRYLRA